MLNIDSVTTSKHPFILDVEEIFGYKFDQVSDLIAGSSHPTVLTDGFDQYFLDNLFKKVRNVDLGLDPATKTLNTFIERIKQQRDENEVLALRLNNLDRSTNFGKSMIEARKFMHRALSGFQGYKIRPRFTFGATIECKRGESVFSRLKHMRRYNDAIVNMSWNSKLFNSVPFRELLLYPMVDENHVYDSSPYVIKIMTVWKTAADSRVIGLHESGLMPIQNGFGDYLTQVLNKYSGIDISTAQRLHRELAYENSLTGEFATSDQRNASNNVLRALVEFLTPDDVFDFMTCITPRIVDVNGVQLESFMMCPQGNGYIFPLQTLIFYSLIYGIQRTMGLKQPIYVYGDDVILHNTVFDAFNKTLHLLYMEPNLAKSYNDVLIRESCGADFVYGTNIRALYVNNLPTTTQDWIVLANGIRRVGYYNNGGYWRDWRYLRLWVRVVHRIEKDERFFCPRILGDAGINIESSKRYQLSYDDRSVNVPRISGHRWEKYPNKGYNSSGLPYSAARIKVFTTYSHGEHGTTVIDELKGLPRRSVLRVLPTPSLAKAGFTAYTESQVEKTGKSGYYPAVFNLPFTSVRVSKIPFATDEQAPEDITRLFDFISSNSGNYITDTERTLEIYEFKRQCRLRDLRDVLVRIVQRHDRLARESAISYDIF